MDIRILKGECKKMETGRKTLVKGMCTLELDIVTSTINTEFRLIN